MKKIVPQDAVLIPDTATRKFEGSLFEVYSWDQEQFDGSNKTFEMIKRPDSVDVFVVRDTKILLLKEEQPHKGLSINPPSGRLEIGETWLEAAKRELLEETGLSCAKWKLIDVAQPVSKMEWFVATFVATDIESEAKQLLDAGEKIELQWLDFAMFRDMVMGGRVNSLQYLMPMFTGLRTAQELIDLPAFPGMLTER